MIGSMIGTLLPAALALKTKLRRGELGESKAGEMDRLIFQYMIEVLKNVILTVVTITYVLKVEDVNFSALSSFPFFSKYVVIAVMYAWLLPYFEEIVLKYIRISFKIEVEENAEEKTL